MQPSLLIIICLAIIILILLGLKKYNERVMQTLIEEADAFVGNIIKSKSLKSISTHINLKNGEVAFLQCNSVLKETRNVRYYQSGHAGLRVMKGFYIGKTSGQSQSNEILQYIDSGILILTNQRLIFTGSSNTRSILINKLITVTSNLNSIIISCESRQKNMIFIVNNPFIWELTIKLISFVQDPLNLTENDINFLKPDKNDISDNDINFENEISVKTSLPSINNEQIFSFNHYLSYNSRIQAKYIVKRDNLINNFKYGYDFLRKLESNDQGIWLSTATNAHLYLRNNYLAYIVINHNSISIRAGMNQHIHSGTIDNSNLMFSSFQDMITTCNGFNDKWALREGEFFTLTNTTPNYFFTVIYDYISNLGVS